MGKTVVVFDFDRTIIDGDSDNWVVTQMGLSPLFNELRSTMPWNSLMNKMMEELHSQGKTTENIAQCLIQTPLEPEILSAIKAAHTSGCDLRIISDANQFFIEAILRHHGLLGCFTEIITNPTLIDKAGRLKIFPYHDFESSPHGCDLCPANMCKGLILEQMRASVGRTGKKTFIYLGDGRGDYCPSLKLSNGDHIMPRSKYPLSELVSADPTLIKAQVHEWNDAQGLHRIILNLIGNISTVDNSPRCDHDGSRSASPASELGRISEASATL